MFIAVTIFILLLPVAILPLALKTFFTSSELNEMGVSLENPSAQPLSEDVCPSTLNLPKVQVVCGNS